LIALQISGRISLRPQTLNRIRHRLLIGRHRLPDRRKVVDVIRHHLQHIRERHQRNKRRIVSLLLRGIGQGRPSKARILRQPIRDVEDLLRISRSRRNLRQQRIRIERNRSQQLVELLRSRRRRRSLGLQDRSNTREQQENDHQ
jgi:hypothetical protein